MESKQHRLLSNSWIVIGILIVVITLATLIAMHQLRQQGAPEYENPNRSKAPLETSEKRNPAEKRLPPSRKSTPTSDKTIKELVRAWNQGQADDIAETFA